MTRKEADFIGEMNMCDEISNEAYRKIMCHCEEQEPCEDCISRQALLKLMGEEPFNWTDSDRELQAVEDYRNFRNMVEQLPSVNPQKTGHCKDCKYFEYDSVAKVGGIPLIVAHEICNRWGDGCKTSEEGFCFLFEPQESEVAE